MSKDKYPSIFSGQMATIVYIYIIFVPAKYSEAGGVLQINSLRVILHV